MSRPKIVRRPAVGGARRLSREELADLALCFAGLQASAWVLLLPEYSNCGAQVREAWQRWAAEHPGAKMPDAVSATVGTTKPKGANR